MRIVAVLELKGVTKQFGGLTAVSEVDLKIEKNQICSLIGPNGAGKTTVFNIITGVYQVTKGDIFFEGRSICGCAPYKIVDMGIARAMATQPKILLLDEPAAGMNAQEKEELIRTIRGIRNDFGISVLIVEHDMDLIMNISDDITVLNYGARIAHGVPEEIQNNEEVIEAYLGRSDS